MTHRHTSTMRLVKIVAVCLSVLLLQALGAAIVHVTLVEHTYCDSHQAFEHADEAGDTIEHQQHAGVDDAHHAPDDDGPTDESCDWLTWLQGPTVPVPAVHASVLDLPPPGATTCTQPVARRALLPSPIELLRLSPGHSPPVRA